MILLNKYLIIKVIFQINNKHIKIYFCFSEVDSTVKAVSPPAVCTIPTVVGRNVIPRMTNPHNPAQGQPHLNGISNMTKNVTPKRSHSPSIDGTPKRLKDIEKVKLRLSRWFSGCV